MRDARIADHWRHIREKSRPVRIKLIAFDRVPALGTGSVLVDGGVVAVCGLNGAGKTTLMNAAFACLNAGPLPREHGAATRLSNGELRLTLCHRGKEFTILRDLRTGNTKLGSGESVESLLSQLSVAVLDTAAVCPRLQHYFRSDPHLEDVLEPVEPAILDREELALVNYIVGKDYEAVEVYEPERVGDFEDFPYFSVRALGNEYGSEDMGAGEFAALYLFWALRRLPKESIILLEEPETFLSPRSQEAIVNLIAKYCDEHKHSCLLTTHSPFVLSRLDREFVRIAVPGLSGAVFSPSAGSGQHMDYLGLGRRKMRLAFVEDKAGQEFMRFLLGRFRSGTEADIEIVQRGSDSKVASTLSELPKGVRGLSVLGVVDGDLRGKTYDVPWPVRYLPSDAPPDALVKHAVLANRGAFAQKFGIADSALDMALAVCAGYEHHDWPNRLAGTLNIGVEQLLWFGFAIWLEDTANQTAASAFVDEVAQLLEAH